MNRKEKVTIPLAALVTMTRSGDYSEATLGQIGALRRVWVGLCFLVIPYAIFAAAILPWSGLWQRVVNYHSTGNMPLWSMLNVGNILGMVPATYLFGGAMLLMGLVYRRRSPVEMFACYTMHCSGDTTGGQPWYRLMCALLVLHLATRDV